jgi:hypothetical protein
MNGILCQMRICDVALHSFDRQLSAHRAAPSVLDHVAGALQRRRLSHDAPIRDACRGPSETSQTLTVPSTTAFLVARQQKGDRQIRSGFANRNSSHATTIAAMDAFISAAPRPYRFRFDESAANGGLVH